MSVDQTAPHQCPVCTVVGLPILPLRYALAWAGEDVPADKRAPRLSAPFDASPYPGLGTEQAHYTLRLLRGGYLYVYDEARREWSAYEVTPGGALYVFDIDDGPSAGDKETSPALCSRTAPRSLSRCIQVKNAARAGKLWLAHSDTQWTEAVKAQHEDASYRARHMRCIDVGAWYRSKGQQAQRHVLALKEVFERVGEYALEAVAPSYQDRAEAGRNSTRPGVTDMAAVQVVPQPAFVFSPYDFSAHARNDFAGVLWGATPDAPVPEHPYAMVALDDPVGITAEVAALMNDRLEAFMTRPERVRPMAASAAIMQLRGAVEHQAVLQAIENTERSRNSQRWMADYADLRGGAGAGWELREEADQMVLTADRLDRIGRQAWASEGYQERYDEQGRSAFQSRCDQELKVLDETVIAPLAAAHLKLLESTKLQVHLECNYDTADERSGAGYLGALLSCIADTQDKAPQAQLYGKWLEGDPREKSNLLLRAYALNQDRLAEGVAKAAEEAGQVKYDELPWDQLFGLYGSAESVAGGSVVNVWMATLIKETLGPVAKLLGKAVDGPVKLYGLVAWGAAGRVPLAKVTLAGKTSGQLVREVMAAMESATGQRPRYQAIHSELKRLRIFGLDTEQRRADIGFIGVRQDGSLVPAARYRTQRDGFITNRLVNWRAVMDTDLRVGLAGSLLSAVALSKVYEQATQSMRHEREESWVRFWTAGAGLLGGALELGGKQAEKLGNAKPRLARWVVIGERIAVFGRALTAVAGFFMAGVDFWRARKELQRENIKMTTFYALSGLSGAGLTIAIIFSSLFWTGIFFVLVVLVAIAIMVWGDSALHAWLDRCLWGQLKNERYKDMSTEQNEFKLAVSS
ncbi:T6SS effector BTH_I2691 family protein [Stenotrophomonas sp. MMGLT7]|uniref:T6SS effector BTH_I2691 family protein n=1 Tax=Stenotrophomonas sp. MMGLT7 TaxID=2901227 RepID=UPI001E36E9AA|nr:T6SS effector BTH_I2691 family protein [Stenotrophomonas sp. MMGLT7]MCD7099533.1 hypothetical protein [Stenotrophomonas sp. MMGLT7]